MCLNPFYIKNPTKFIHTKYRQRLFLSVPCGQCAECQHNKQNEWYFRTYYQYLECISTGGYVLFDCLTYRSSDLPYLSEFMDVDTDYPCFDYSDLRYFIVRLRRYLEHAGYDCSDNLKYFIASEYGTEKGCTHRPHYHVLFFVNSSFIDPLSLSSFVDKAWQHGRTDGVPYKGNRYVLDHCVIRGNLASSLRVCGYVSKYVVKNSTFQKTIDARIYHTLRHHYQLQHCSRFSYSSTPTLESFDLKGDDIDEVEFRRWLRGSFARKLKNKLRRIVGQNHYQSVGFGASALADIDLLDLQETGSVLVPSASKVKMRIPLPMYYKRKLFYERVKYRGSIYWQLNEAGIEYVKSRQKTLVSEFKDRLYEMNTICPTLTSDISDLADYWICQRGKFNGIHDDVCTIETIAQSREIDLVFNYSHSSDVQRFGRSFQSKEYIGCSQNGYSSAVPIIVTNLDGSEYKSYLGDKIHMLPSSWLSDNCFRNDAYEVEINSLITAYNDYLSKQSLSDRLTELRDKYKFLGYI